MPIFGARFVAYEKNGYFRFNGLDDICRIFARKSEWLRINYDEIIFFKHYHMDCRGGVFDGVNLISFISQYAVQVFYQDRIGRTKDCSFHGKLIKCNSYAMKVIASIRMSNCFESIYSEISYH
jgi:hypothetical protein